MERRTNAIASELRPALSLIHFGLHPPAGDIFIELSSAFEGFKQGGGGREPDSNLLDCKFSFQRIGSLIFSAEGM